MSTNQDLRPVVQNLESKGSELIPVDFNDMQSIQQGLRGIDTMVFVPPMQQEKPDGWPLVAERILQAAKAASVKSVLMISFIGCDQASAGLRLRAFEKMETKVKEIYGQQQSILRINFGQQHLRLWARRIQVEGGKLSLPLGDSKIAPVELTDVTRCIAKFMESQMELPKEFRGQVFNLTGSKALTGKEIADLINEICLPKTKAQYKPCKREENEDATYIVEECRKRMSQENWGEPWMCTRAYVELILDILDVARDGKLQETTKDVHRITGQEPTPIDRMLKQYQKEFQSQA